MKHKLIFIMTGIMLVCVGAVAQQSEPATSPAPYAGATVSDFKGKVNIQLPAQALAAPVRGEILPAESTVSTEDGRLLLKLADGSDILVRPHTRLVLKQPETNGWRYFQMLIGRVRTSIQKHLGGTPAFQIGTPSAVISVRGTRFDVEVDRRGFTQVDVEEGVVQLEASSGRGESVLITAGFSSRVGMETGPEVPRPTHDLRPQLDRPGRKEGGIWGNDDDPIKNIAEQRDSGDHHDGDSSGSDSGSRSSGGSDSGDRSSGSDSGSTSSGDRSGGDDHHHGGRPPEFI